MAREPQFSWWAGHGERPEAFTLNEATRDAVIAAGRCEWPGETFTIVEATQDGAFAAEPFANENLLDQVIEQFCDDNSNRFGEDGYDGDLDHEALAKALNDTFARFIDHHGDSIRTWSFTAQRNLEVIAKGADA